MVKLENKIALLCYLKAYEGETNIDPNGSWKVNYIFDEIQVEDGKLTLKISRPMLEIYEYYDGEDDATITKHIQSEEEENADGVFIGDEDEQRLAIISMSKNGKDWAFEYEDGEEIGYSVGVCQYHLVITIRHPKINNINFDGVVDLTDVLKDALWENDVTYEGLELDDVFRKSIYIIPGKSPYLPATEVTIPEGTKKIRDSKYCNCEYIEDVSLPDSLEYIEEAAFSHCFSLKNINIPDGVTEIGDNAFESCKSLESINIPAGLTVINWYAFCECSSLKSVCIPMNVKIIQEGAFSECSSLKEVTIENPNLEIEDGAFEGCNAIETVNLPEGLTRNDVLKHFENTLWAKAEE